MQRKLFIAINLPSEVQKRLAQKTEKWQDLPVKWTSKDCLHITLVFLGHVEDAILPETCRSVNEAVNDLKPFEVRLSEIVVGPSENRPRIIWAVGEKNEELKKMVEKIEKSLGVYAQDKKEFTPHATLGRIRGAGWKTLPSAPEVKEKINLIIPVDQVEILESVIEDGKRKYLLIESCPLA
jgi:RNA 2',3'-cyclic 3'-phosphodiesterase